MEGRVADELDAGRMAARLRRRRIDRTDADVVRVRGRVDLIGEVRRATDERIGSGERTGGSDVHVLLADMAAVGAGGGDEVGPVVEDQQRAGVVAERPRDRGGGEQLAVARLLVAQLHDVDAARERGREHAGQVAAAGMQVADEVQAGVLQPRAALVEVGHHGHCGNGGPSRMNG